MIPGEIYRLVIESIEEKDVPRDSEQIFSLVRHGGKWSRLSNRITIAEEKNRPNQKSRRIGDAGNQHATSQSVWASTVTKSPIAASRQGERDANRRDWINWKVVAGWMDTEGYLYTKEGRRRRYCLAIKQNEPEPLIHIQRFFHDQG